MKALIVDDDFISRSLLLRILSRFGDCDVAVSGDEAKTAYQLAHKKNEPYDVIYLDIVMPGRNGYDVLEQIREYEEKQNMKNGQRASVIMVTGLDDPELIMDAFKEQCDGFVIKPVSEAKIIEASSKAGICLTID